MTKFKLRGDKQATWPLKVKKTMDINRMVEGKIVASRETRIEKVHLKGNTEYDSNSFDMSIDEIRKQLGDNIASVEVEDKPTEQQKI